MFEKLKKLFRDEEPVVVQPAPVTAELDIREPILTKPKVKKPRKPKQPKPEVKLHPKEEATLKGDPYINVIKVEIDPNDINNGAFELDWNDKFVLNLIKSGYKIRDDDTDSQIVDRWFQTVCRNIALEIYEQEQADPEKRDDVRIIRSRDIGNGRTEVS